MFTDPVSLVRFLVWGAVVLLGWSAVAALLQTDLFAPLLVKWRGMSRFQKGMVVVGQWNEPNPLLQNENPMRKSLGGLFIGREAAAGGCRAFFASRPS